MSDETERVRLLPWTGVHGRSALLLTDGNGPVSRLADRMEAVQLGLGERLLGRARELLTATRPRTGELRLLTDQLANALADALLIAGSRGARLGRTGRDPAGGTLPALRAYGLLSLPGRDLASARAARHYVRDTCRSWGLSPGEADDLVAVAGELVANALEHTDSRTVTITCALTADTVTVGVTDDGMSGTGPVVPTTTGSPGPECESGRGLLITDVLAMRWGTQRTGEGLTVWAEVAVGAAADTAGSG
ncbi:MULTISPECIES: ATP-binding protein [unclassified Streptomyces]|uniref:ATP-binding protein n=1 Tax=unclassified Streptomyces TaxID=2593676 RepID=UPI0035D8EC63